MGSDFDLKEVLRYGSVPIIWRAPHKPDRLDAYAQLYSGRRSRPRRSCAICRASPVFCRSRRSSTGNREHRRPGAGRRRRKHHCERLHGDSAGHVSRQPASPYEAKLRVKERSTRSCTGRTRDRSSHETTAARTGREERGAFSKGGCTDCCGHDRRTPASTTTSRTGRPHKGGQRWTSCSSREVVHRDRGEDDRQPGPASLRRSSGHRGFRRHQAARARAAGRAGVQHRGRDRGAPAMAFAREVTMGRLKSRRRVLPYLLKGAEGSLRSVPSKATAYTEAM